MDLPPGVWRVALMSTDACGQTQWLSMSGLGEVHMMSYVIEEAELLTIDVHASGLVTIRSGDGLYQLNVASQASRKLVGVLCATAANGARVESYFVPERIGSTRMFTLRAASNGAAVARTEGGDTLVAAGSMFDGARPACAFMLVARPTVGAITRSALFRMRQDAEVAIWGVESRVWLTVHPPPTFLNRNGGKVRVTCGYYHSLA